MRLQGHNLQVQPGEVTHSGMAAIKRHLWAVYFDWAFACRPHEGNAGASVESISSNKLPQHKHLRNNCFSSWVKAAAPAAAV